MECLIPIHYGFLVGQWSLMTLERSLCKGKLANDPYHTRFRIEMGFDMWVAARNQFQCSSFIALGRGVLEPCEVKNHPLPLLWPLD